MVVKIILYIASSIDGYIAAFDGSVAWLDKYNESGEEYGYKEFVDSVNTILMGKTTYDQVLSFGEYPYKNLKGYVFGTGVKDTDFITAANGDVKEFINTLEKDKDHNIWLMGGANLVNQFLKYNLIDEFIIFVMPTILGNGIRLFENINQESSLVLKESKSYKSGVVELHYTI